jgi:hypothetical protein
MASADASNKVFIVLVMGLISFAVIAARGRCDAKQPWRLPGKSFSFF